MSSFCNSYFPNVIPSTSMTENNSFVFRANLGKKQNPLKQKKNADLHIFLRNSPQSLSCTDWIVIFILYAVITSVIMREPCDLPFHLLSNEKQR